MTRREKVNNVILIILWSGAILFALLSSSCRTRYLPVETIRERVLTDTLIKYSIHHQRDSSGSEMSERIEIRDSMAPVLDSAGRLLAFERWHFEYRSSSRNSERVAEKLTADSSMMKTQEIDTIRQKPDNRKLIAAAIDVDNNRNRFCIFVGIMAAAALLVVLRFLFKRKFFQ